MKKEFENLEYETVLFSLKSIGIEKIIFDYSGEGDSGSINEISFFNSNEDAIYLDKEYDKLINDLEDKIYDILMCITDWYNNDGGGGNIEVFTSNGTYIIHNHIRTIRYHNEKYKGSIQHFKKHNKHTETTNLFI